MILLSAKQYGLLSIFPNEASNIQRGLEEYNMDPDSCMRPCRHRKNKIILDHFGLNGLSDRESIFRVMTDLAGYLCATVYAPPPSTMLSVSHNGNQPISRSLLWRDFYSIRFRQDHSIALKQFQANLASGNLATDPLVLSQVKQFRRSTSGVDPWFRVVTRQEEDAVAHIAQLNAFVQKQQLSQTASNVSKDAFLWEVYVPHFRWRNDVSAWFSNSTSSWRSAPDVGLLVDDRVHCSYTQHQPSSLAAEIVENVFEDIRQQQQQQHHSGIHSYAVFHIRRGDTIDSCDTSLSEIYKYLSCSFRDRALVTSHYGRVTILLASDERDSCYRSAVATLVEKGLEYDFLDLDATVQKVLNEVVARTNNGSRLMNNMYIYHISRLITKDPRIKINLEKRRTVHCPACTNVVEQYSPSSGARFDSFSHSPPFQQNERLSKKTIDEYERCVVKKKQQS